MDTQAISPQNTDERIVWFAITGTYIFYILGALYIVAPVIGWILLMRYFWQRWNQIECDRQVPFAIWVWITGMLVMLISLIIGHLINDLGTAKLIKSSIGWAKGWALLAIFPLISMMNIRAELIIRACMIVCRHTLFLLPVFVGAWLVSLPQTLYISPLKIIGGPGPEFFALSLYEIDPGSGSPRWRMFTPWAPALGMVANIYFILALQEKSTRWRFYGIAGSLAMIFMSQSRLALVTLVVVWTLSTLLSRLNKPSTYFLGAAIFTIAGTIGEWLVQSMNSFWEGFRAARADSTRVREALARIAVDRWQNDSPAWGHGIVERGPHLVEYMPIGSHHSWFGLLFVKGMVGLLSLAIPMFVSFIDLLIKAQNSSLSRTGLAMLVLLFLYTFGENLEILAYLFWPALIMLGIAHQQKYTKAECSQSESGLKAATGFTASRSGV